MGKARGWSYWTRNKLEILQGYLPAFNSASKKSSERIYIDLMAGEPENFDRDTGERFDGSARIALEAQPTFTRFAFGELPPKATRLKDDLDSRYRSAPFRVYPGDCNVTVDHMLSDLRDVRWAPMFAFLDQQAAELSWDTMAKLAGFRAGKTKVEQWILWSPAMIVKGVAGTNGAAFADKVDNLYGSGRWRQILNARVAAKVIEAPEFRSEMVNLLRWQFENQLGYGHTIRIPMTMKNNLHLYDMIFATDHDAGLKIMSHLYKKAAEREPRMKQEAIDAGPQGALFPDYSGPIPEWTSEPCWDPSGSSWWRC